MREWIASTENPVYLYYCKTNWTEGNTIIILQGNEKTVCRKVTFANLFGEFAHGNTVGKAKASGARAALKIVSGRVELEDKDV